MTTQTERATKRIMVKPSIWARVANMRKPGESHGQVLERLLSALEHSDATS